MFLRFLSIACPKAVRGIWDQDLLKPVSDANKPAVEAGSSKTRKISKDLRATGPGAGAGCCQSLSSWVLMPYSIRPIMSHDMSWFMYSNVVLMYYHIFVAGSTRRVLIWVCGMFLLWASRASSRLDTAHRCDSRTCRRSWPHWVPLWIRLFRCALV